MAWTPQQNNVITHRGGNLLVSAAAGSGKTAVLVERILQRITDPDHPVDIDRILVVTFTKAAAAEMRERIADALSARLEADPENANLQRQSALLPNAKISTIDSFCQSVIRNQFYRIDLEPAFRVGDEGEMKVMRQDVLDSLFEKLYARSDPGLLRAAAHFSTDRSDDKLKEIILQIYDYAMSEPWPRRWLEECRQVYRSFADADWLISPWMISVTENLRGQISGLADAYRALIAQALSPGGPYMYEDALQSDRRQLLQAAEMTDFERLCRAVRAFDKIRLAPCRDKAVDPDVKELIQKVRNGLTDQVAKLQKEYFAQTPAQMQAQMQAAAPDALALCDLTEAFLDAFSAQKRAQNILDFSDLEHDALQILVDAQTQQPTGAALEYQDFFEEIMIDEYQDSNYVQELLLMSISRQESEHPNVFMVGDVKQSIYGFRLARPDLFMEKYHTYEPLADPDQDAGRQPPRSGRIELRTNFRSRPSVLHSVNAVFDRLMCEDIGGITYGPEVALYPGAQIYPEEDPEAYRTEVLLTDRGIEAETALIAQRIQELTDPAGPLLITDKGAQAPRPVRYHDIVILMRSLGEKADKMAQQLNDAGIPAYVQSKTGYFSAPEVRTLLSFLQIIDNPRQDIPLAAVLRSPVYDINSDALARIRIESPQTDFYDAVTYYAAEGPDDALRERLYGFLEDLQDYRMHSRMLQIHELLAYLLRRSGYDKIVSAQPAGAQRLTNIRMLQERAAAFEKTSYHGLFQFNRYMEQLDTYDVDYGEASAVGENDDAVRIITIHQSKGLEYPVVFLSALGSRFNKNDLGKSVQLHAQCGIGIDVFDRDKRTRASTILKKAIRLMNETGSVGEEMRVLYVGMTRAREKLILTAAGDDASGWEAMLQEPAEAGTVSDDPAASAAGAVQTKPQGQAVRPLSFYDRLKAGCFMDWIAAALSAADGVCTVRYLPADALAQTDARQIVSRRLRLPELEAMAQQADPALTAAVAARFAAAHQTAGRTELPAKVSVSELKLDRIRENGEDPEELFPQTHRKHYVPQFARGTAEEASAAGTPSGEVSGGDTGASYGTAVHRVMECLDFAGCADAIAADLDMAPPSPDSETRKADAGSRQSGTRRQSAAARRVLEAQLAQMRADGRISQEIAQMVSRRALTAFLQSDLFRRMARADRQGRLIKERPFVMHVPADEVREDASAGETVLVQGIIDAYFEEDGGIVLVDYKTDRVDRPSQLSDRYRRQMELYAQALTGGRGLQVSQMLLYSFALDTAVPV